MIDIPKVTATINTEEVEPVELPPIVATIETKENFVELPKVVADIRPETAIVGNLGMMVAGKGKDGKDGNDGNDGKDGVDGRPGKDGSDGRPGRDGINGKDGKDGATPHIGDNGNWFIDDFDTGVCAVGRNGLNGAPGKDGYTPRLGIDYFNGKDGRDGIDGRPGRNGKNGKDGLSGLNGTDGFSPKVLVEEIEGGHKITITDKDGEKSFDVMDGQGGNGDGGAGENGFSPTISVEEIENGHRITITDIDGTKTIDVLDGKNGIDGKDGYTPIKGVDYFDGEQGPQGIQGEKGEPGTNGLSGVYYGTTKPTDPSHPIWINPEGADSFQTLVDAVLQEASGVPFEYLVLDYIETTGSQYINTRFKHNQNTRVVIDAETTIGHQNHSWLYEGRVSSSVSSKGVFLLSGKTWNADYDNSGNRVSFPNVSSIGRVKIDYNKNVLTINGVTHTFEPAEFQSTVDMCLMACNTNGEIAGFITGRLYTCQIYDNDKLVRDYVPVKHKTSGVIGLYDRANSVFYANAGDGEFIEGLKTVA